MFSLPILLFLLVPLTRASAIPSKDINILSRTIIPDYFQPEVQARSAIPPFPADGVVELLNKTVYHIPTLSALSLGPDVTEQVVSDVVAVAVIGVFGKIAGQVCEAGIVTLQPWYCAAVVATACLAFLMATFGQKSGNTDKRFIAEISTDIHQPWLAQPGCDTKCRLDAEFPDDQWLSVGNTTVQGVLHDLHHWRSGTLRGVRAYAINTTTALDTRQEAADAYSYGGYVAAYYWDDGNQAAWSDWHRTDTAGIDTTVGEYMYNNDAAGACVDTEDPDGFVAMGVMTMDVNNLELVIPDSTLQSWLDACYD